MGERYVEFDELHGLKDVISDLRISRDISLRDGLRLAGRLAGRLAACGTFLDIACGTAWACGTFLGLRLAGRSLLAGRLAGRSLIY